MKNTDPNGNLTSHGLKVALRQGPYTWPGGYPCFFVTSDGCALSFDAVRQNFRRVLSSVRNKDNDGWRVVAVDVNYEDPELFCDHTGQRIESAYAEEEQISISLPSSIDLASKRFQARNAVMQKIGR